MLTRPLHALEAARGNLFPFIPVFMAMGIGLWFTPLAEPSLQSYVLAGLALVAGVAVRLRGAEAWHPLAVALACVAFGFLASGARAHMQKAPILGFRYYGAVEGRVIDVDRSNSDHIRLTLDRVVLERTSPERTPEKVRISLHGDQSFYTPQPGGWAMMTAHLDAPMPPAAPGGFDFRRMAFFDRLGALGYTRTPVLALAPPEAGTQWINRLRAHMSAGVQARIDGQAGAFASGSVTGDRSGITQETVVALRDSNLSHLLAISGMNLAFLVAFTFGVFRYGFALVPYVALRLNTKKLAAVASLGVAWFYFSLSGGNVATERAFIMVCVMLGAILFDRRALSMRTVSVSAVILLTMQPEALMHPGFQMSMAATVMLVWGFGLVDRKTYLGHLPRWTLPVYTAVLSSVLGGLATGPIAAATFNRFTDYGLVANLLTVPAMGMLIMPGAVVATLLWPIGLQAPGMWMMELGARWIIGVAHWVAGWGGAVRGVPEPGPWVLPLLCLGAIWGIVWPGRARWAGVVPMAAALVVWGLHPRPPVLISADAAQVGMFGPEGRALSSPRGAGFASAGWLEDDGDLVPPEIAAARPGFEGEAGERWFTLNGKQVVHLKGRGASDKVADYCRDRAILIVSTEWEAELPTDCLLIDRLALQTTGALELWPEGDGVALVPSLDSRRMWTRPPRGGTSLPGRYQ